MVKQCMSILVADRYKTRIYCRSFAGIAGSNPAGGTNVSVESVMCCQVEVCATSSLVQRSPTD
jgi:hypothetical protein